MPPRGVKETLSRSSLRALQPVGYPPRCAIFSMLCTRQYSTIRADLGAASQREAAHALVVPEVGKDRLHCGDEALRQSLFGRSD
jgi:hypothetical protein